MRQTTKNNIVNFTKAAAVIATGIFCTELLAADDAGGAVGIGKLAQNVKGSFVNIGDLILATARVAGIGFTVAAIFKFKQHKDNPTQVTIGTPFALLAVGVMLMFMKGIFDPAAETIYGTDGNNKMTYDGFDNMGAGGSGGS